MVSVLFCLALAIEIARLLLNDDDDDRPPDAAERPRSAFELVKQWHRRVERNMCFFVCALTGRCYNLDPGGQNSCDSTSPGNLAARDVTDTVTTSWMPNEIDAARPDSCYCGNTDDTAHRFFFLFVLLFAIATGSRKGTA